MRFPGDFWTARLDPVIMTQISQIGVRCKNVTEIDDDDSGAISSLGSNGPPMFHSRAAISNMIAIILRRIGEAMFVARAFRCAKWVFAERFVENTAVATVELSAEGNLPVDRQTTTREQSCCHKVWKLCCGCTFPLSYIMIASYHERRRKRRLINQRLSKNNALARQAIASSSQTVDTRSTPLANSQDVGEDGFDMASDGLDVNDDTRVDDESSAHMTDDDTNTEGQLCMCRNCCRQGPDVDLSLTGDDTELGEFLTLAFVVMPVEEIGFSRKFCLFRKAELNDDETHVQLCCQCHIALVTTGAAKSKHLSFVYVWPAFVWSLMTSDSSNRQRGTQMWRLIPS